MPALPNKNNPPQPSLPELFEGIYARLKELSSMFMRHQPVGQLFNTVTHGIRNMAGYGTQIPTDDRWAIVAYVKALQRSFDAQLQDVPPDQRSKVQ
jgi:hypothetical protein